MMNWRELQRAIFEWGNETFNTPPNDPLPNLKHLQDEVEELIEAPDDIYEYADCFILLMQAAERAGHNMDDLLTACNKKFKKNTQREWGKLNKDGFSHHKE